MTALTENDLKRLEDLIVGIANGQKAIETRLTTLEVGQAEIKRDIKALQEGQQALQDGQQTLQEGQQALAIGQMEIKGEIKATNTRIDGVSDRIKLIETSVAKIPDLSEKVGEFKVWRQMVIIASTALVSGLVTWIVRGGNFNP